MKIAISDNDKQNSSNIREIRHQMIRLLVSWCLVISFYIINVKKKTKTAFMFFPLLLFVISLNAKDVDLYIDIIWIPQNVRRYANVIEQPIPILSLITIYSFKWWYKLIHLFFFFETLCLSCDLISVTTT